MRIVRFDEEVSIPIADHGSAFRIGSLTGDDSNVRVQLMYLPANGRIGRHVTDMRQMLAVITGSGWASGEDREQRAVEAGRGAIWERGESHEAWTDTGLTAICIEGDFDDWAVTVTKEIIVSDYSPKWPKWFERVREYVWPAVEDVALRIEHVGSTSVPGLAAKPVIDTDVVVATDDDVRPAIKRLSGIGYRWRGDLGVEGRQAFSASGPVVDAGLPPHHLYVVVENNKAHVDHWVLRDLLRSDPIARSAYAELKRRNAAAADSDMDYYVAAKARLVADLLERGRAERGLPPASYWVPEETS